MCLGLEILRICPNFCSARCARTPMAVHLKAQRDRPDTRYEIPWYQLSGNATIGIAPPKQQVNLK